MRKLVVLVLDAVGVLLLAPAVASASTPTLKSLAKSLAALQKRVNSLQGTVKAANGKILTLQGRATTLQGKVAKQASAITTLQSKLTSQATTIATLQSVVGADASHCLRLAVFNLQGGLAGLTNTVSGHTTSITNLQNSVDGLQGTLQSHANVLALEPYVKVFTSGTLYGVKGPNILLQGCNLNIRSTTSETDTTGTGNLIVGWDDPSSGGRTGSNNLVCGDQNSFTSYGGFVAGFGNVVSDLYASISGGSGNTASDDSASVSGGTGNHASAVGASVSGGTGNTASNLNASVSGGLDVTESSLHGWSAGGTFHNP